MRWQGGRRSSNIEDRRGMGVGRPLAAGGGIATVLVALVVMLLGGNPDEVLSNRTRGPGGDVGIGGSGGAVDPAQAQLEEFVSVVLADTAIGDDTLQRRAGGRVVPESFTHGSSAQRVQWFRRGFEQGTVEACDTFGAASRGR